MAEIETYFKIPEPDPVSTGVGKWFCLRINCEAAFLLLCGRVAFLFCNTGQVAFEKGGVT